MVFEFFPSLTSGHVMLRGDEKNDANSFAIMRYHLPQISSEIEVNEGVFIVFVIISPNWT